MNLRGFNFDYFSPMLFKKINLFSLAMLLYWFFLSCSTALYIPKESLDISREELNELLKGRDLYISKCGSCHTLWLPEKYNALQWKFHLERMVVKANLTSKETEEISRYVSKNDTVIIRSDMKKKN